METNIEQKLAQIRAALEGNGRFVPKTLAEIHGFPFDDFEHLKQLILSKKLMVQKFSFEYSPEVAELFFSKTEIRVSSFVSYGYIIGPIVAFIISFIFSWWFLILALLIPLYLSSVFKNIYKNALFRTAFSSESAFCFLYYIGQISIVSDNPKKIFFYTI